MAKAAADGGTVAQANEMVIDAMPCKSCHDTYRIPES
jgi:cytochrome c556